jgi:hypothetical protein
MLDQNGQIFHNSQIIYVKGKLKYLVFRPQSLEEQGIASILQTGMFLNRTNFWDDTVVKNVNKSIRSVLLSSHVRISHWIWVHMSALEAAPLTHSVLDLVQTEYKKRCFLFRTQESTAGFSETFCTRFYRHKAYAFFNSYFSRYFLWLYTSLLSLLQNYVSV